MTMPSYKGSTLNGCSTLEPMSCKTRTVLEDSKAFFLGGVEMWYIRYNVIKSCVILYDSTGNSYQPEFRQRSIRACYPSLWCLGGLPFSVACEHPSLTPCPHGSYRVETPERNKLPHWCEHPFAYSVWCIFCVMRSVCAYPYALP